ncbi:S8 family serine peptidase [Bacteroidota bacterium]
MMNKIRLLFIVFLVVLFSESAFSQTETNVAELKKIAQEEEQKFKENRKIAEEYALLHGLPIRYETAEYTIEIMSINEFGIPVYYLTNNLNAAKTTRANKLWSGGGLGLSYSGSGYTKLGEWDGGGVLLTHQEFGSRVSQIDTPSATHYHATHVAGTMIASGADGNAKGMAYAANLKAYDWNNDASEMATAAAAGMELSNHSYGLITGWYYSSGPPATWYWYGNTLISSTEDYNFGFYNSDAQTWDNIAYNAPYYLIVKSAGNDRGDGPTPGTSHKVWNGSAWVNSTATRDYDGGSTGYDCIADKGVAKNLLTIGAVNQVVNYQHQGDLIMSSFSGWGPVDDGRIKPDIVAKGVNVYSTDNTGTTNYLLLNGTSMASPNATGTLVLLQEHYQNTHSSAVMRSATLKGLVIHTADEAGDYTGPDYKFGWGLLNAEAAADLISIDASYQNVIDEQTLSNSATYSRTVTASGSGPLKVTICWTDPAGTPVSANIDPSDPMLVNDLDLRITYSSSTYYPWKLDRTDPAAAATNNGENNVDNVEQVYIENPVAGNNYTIVVDHDGTLSSPQAFSVIISGIDDFSTTPSSCSVSLINPTNTATGVSPSITIEWERVLDAASYDLYFGTNGGGTSTPTNIVNGTTQYSNTYKTSLASNTTYYIQVVPRNSNGLKSGGCSSIWSFTTATFTTYSSFPHIQNFDAFTSISSGWENESDDDFDWYVNTGSTPSGNTGPSEDHTSGSGKYLYSEASATIDYDIRAHLVSPVFNWSSLTQPVLEFWYHMYGVNLTSLPSKLSVDIYSGGEWHYNVWSKSGQQSSSGTDWQVASIDLNDFKDGSVQRIRFKVYSLNWSSDFAIDDVTISDGITNTWIGTTNDWNTASNWTKTYVPASYIDATIPTSPSGGNFPVITSAASCYNLTINSSAKVNISPAYSLTVNGTLTNSAGNSGLVINSDASGTASLIHNTNNVSGTVERYMSGGSLGSKSGINHYVSSPISSPTWSVLYDVTLGGFNVYTFSSGSFSRVLSGNLINGKGYLVAYNGNKTVNYSGTLNNGTFSSVPISSTADDWNLLGNPYPSAIDADAFILENVTSNSRLKGSLYFWVQSTSFNAGDYATYNSMGGTAATNGGSAPSGSIALGQAFFIQSNGGSSSATFTNSMRNTNNPDFFIPEPDKQLIRLSLEDSEENYNEILLGFTWDASQGEDVLYDAVKLIGNPDLAFYSLINGVEGGFSIQGLPLIGNETKVNLGLIATYGQSLKISVNELQNLDNYKIYLIDKMHNSKTELTASTTYSFNFAEKVNDERFELHFIKNSLGLDKTPLPSRIVYSNADEINLNLDNRGTILVLDMLGKTLASHNVEAGTSVIQLPDFKGAVLVKIITEGQISVHKLIIY